MSVVLLQANVIIRSAFTPAVSSIALYLEQKIPVGTF